MNVLTPPHPTPPHPTPPHPNEQKSNKSTRPSTKRVPTTSQYYFVLQSLHKLLPSTTLYYKACTKHFPVLLCTTKLAQSISQYYFVLQSLHRLLPSTPVYYKPCRKYVPVLHCDIKLAQRKLLHTASFYTQNLLHTASFYRKKFLQSLVHNHNRNCSSKTGWISTPKQEKDDFGALFKITFKRKITSAKIEKIWQIAIAAWMQPLQYDLRCSAAKDTSITHATDTPSNLDAANPMRSAETELQNTKELRATASETAAPKPDLDAKAEKDYFEALCKRIFGRKIATAKIAKICWQITIAAWMQPLQCNLQSSAAARPPHQATLTQPFHCDLQPEIPKHPIMTHTQADPEQLQATITLRQKKGKPTAAATAAQMKYLSSLAGLQLMLMSGRPWETSMWTLVIQQMRPCRRSSGDSEPE